MGVTATSTTHIINLSYMSILHLIHFSFSVFQSEAVVNTTFVPTGCTCGECIAIRSERAAEMLQDNYKGMHKNSLEVTIREMFPCMRSKARFFDGDSLT